MASAGEPLEKRIDLNIAANTRLEDALIEWGTRAGMAIMINTQLVDGRLTQGLKGTFSAGRALSILLTNTGLSYTLDGDRVRVVQAQVSGRTKLRSDDLP